MDFAGTHSTINDSELLYAELVRLLQAECGWMAPSDPALHAAQAAIAKFKNQGRSVSSKSLHHAIANVTLAIDCHRRVSGGRYIRWNAQRGQYVPLSDIHSAASVISSAWRRRCRTHIEEAAGTEAEAPALPLSASPEADLIPVGDRGGQRAATSLQQSPVAAPPEQQSPSRTASPLQMLPLQPSALPSASHHQVHTAQEEEEEEEEVPEEKDLDAAAALASLLENQQAPAEQSTPPPAMPGFKKARKDRRIAKNRARGVKPKAASKNAYGPGGLVSAARAPLTLRD